MEDLGPIILPPMPKPGRNPAENLARMTEWTRQCEQAIRKIGDSLSAAIGEVNTLSSSPSLPTGGTAGEVLAKNSSTNGDAGWFTPHYPPVGGTTGQLLAKNSNTDYDFSWTTNPSSLPTGGTTGQALRKNSATNFDVSFLDVHELPSAGTTGQALVKNSNTNYDASWTTVHQPPAGGSTGQVLEKNSATDYDYSWTTVPAGLPAGGNSRDVLSKNSDTNYDAGWGSILASKKSGVAIDLFEDYSTGAISAPGRGTGWASAGRVVNGSIVTRNLSGGRTHNRLLITPGGQYGRTFSWGGVWSRMVISVLLRIPAVATFTGDYTLGICSGTSAMWGDGSVTNWAGIGSGSPFDSTGSGIWTYTAGSFYHRLQSDRFGGASKVGTTTTTPAGSITGNVPNIGADEITLMPITWLVTRPITATPATNFQLDYTLYSFHGQEHFIDIGTWLEMLFASPFSTGSDFGVLTVPISSNITGLNETPGVFDSINFYWNNSAGINIEVAGVYVARKW